MGRGGELTIQMNRNISRWEPKRDGATNGDSLGFCEEVCLLLPAWVRTKGVIDASTPCCQWSWNTLGPPVQSRADSPRPLMLEPWALGVSQGTGSCFLVLICKWGALQDILPFHRPTCQELNRPPLWRSRRWRHWVLKQALRPKESFSQITWVKKKSKCMLSF